VTGLRSRQGLTSRVRESPAGRGAPPMQPNHKTVIPPGQTFACGECRHLVGKNPGDFICLVHGRICTHCAALHSECRNRRAA